MRGERLRFWLGKRLLKRADLVIAVSQATAADAPALRASTRVAHGSCLKLRTACSSPGRARPSGSRSGGAWRLVTCCSWALWTRARIPPRCFARGPRPRKFCPQLELVVAGDPGRQAPPSMPGATLLGRVSDEELADLYTAAGCFVFPSRYEGFGLPCLEAMACGCPVAAFRNSSMPEVVDDAGTLVDDGDAEALGRAAAEMIGEAERWRRAGLERVRRRSAGARRRSRRSRPTKGFLAGLR